MADDLKFSNEFSKSTDSELSTSSVTDRNPLQDKNVSSVANIKNIEISDEELLITIKNRLKAITLVQNNLFRIERVEEKYNISKNVLFYDVFGFNQDDEEMSSNLMERNYLISKIDSIKAEKDKIFKIVDKSSEDFDLNDEGQKYIQTIPKALVSIKLKIPFFFVNIIVDYLNRHTNDFDQTNKENLNLSDNFIENLFEFFSKIFHNRNDFKKLAELFNESKYFDFEKKSDAIDLKDTQKLEDKNLATNPQSCD